MTEAFPALTVTSDIFVVDGPCITCSGGTGTLDMMLHVIAERHGQELVAAISEQVIHPRVRGQHEAQRMAPEMRHGVSHPKLVAMIGAMERTIEDPLTLTRLAAEIGLSPRQMERLSKAVLGQPPSQFYLRLRLERAQGLLRQTSLSVLEVALASGFVSATHFSRCFRRHYGRTPREDRRGG
jgi:transcriptional regulator GlxA family with amidase domain